MELVIDMEWSKGQLLRGANFWDPSHLMRYATSLPSSGANTCGRFPMPSIR